MGLITETNKVFSKLKKNLLCIDFSFFPLYFELIRQLYCYEDVFEWVEAGYFIWQFVNS